MCSFVSGGLLQCSMQAMLPPYEHRTSVTCALCGYNFALSAHTALLASMWTARCTARCRRWSYRVATIRAWPVILLSFLFLSRWTIWNQLATICYRIARHKPSYGHRKLSTIEVRSDTHSPDRFTYHLPARSKYRTDRHMSASNISSAHKSTHVRQSADL
jgi:hypothetical protein